MRVRTRKAVALVVAIAIVLALLLSLLVVFSDTAAAHAELRESAPKPNQVVGGMVDRVEMAFREPIRPHEANGVALVYPDDTRVLTELAINKRLVRASFEPLTESGTYTVIWELLDDSDGDWVRQEWEFTYDPAAAPPEWLPESAAEWSGGGGISGVTVALIVIIPVAVVLAGWLFWPRRRGADRAQQRRSARRKKSR